MQVVYGKVGERLEFNVNVAVAAADVIAATSVLNQSRQVQRMSSWHRQNTQTFLGVDSDRKITQ